MLSTRSTERVLFCGVNLFRFCLLLFLNSLLVSPVFASADINVYKLAQDKVWQKLLHIDSKQSTSKVSSRKFFISNNTKATAGEELEATLAVLDEPLRAKRLTQVCKFPARYFWLSSKLEGLDVLQDLKHCTKLNQWVGNKDEVSIILVSGYLGNPASTFGHALLKLQRSTNTQDNKLLDAAINFGAITPKGESPLTYVFKGITGGYKATFLDKYYYTQELMYSALESRDMWQYTLNLSRDKTKLLIYHIWELIKQEFDYYYLDENCGYQLVNLLELVMDESLVKDDEAWYVPVEGFRKLESLDAKERREGKKGVLKSIRFLPSGQRKLNYQLSLLNSEEFQIMKKLMREVDVVDIQKELLGLSQTSQQSVLDAALTYYNYRLVKSGMKLSASDKKLKQQVLLARFGLPADSKRLPEVPYQPSPTQGFALTPFGMGVRYTDVEEVYAQLHGAVYLQDTTGQNNLRGDELVILDTTLGLAGNQNDVFLERMDFIRVRKLSNDKMLVRNHDWSWQMNIGIKKEGKKVNSKYDGGLTFGGGKTLILNQEASLYTMIDIAAHTVYPYVRLYPHLGVYFDLGSLKGLWRAGVENREVTSHFKYIWDGELQYQIGKQNSAVIKYKKAVSAAGSLEIRWFW